VCAVPWLLGKCGTSEYASYVKRRQAAPPDGAAPAWAAPDTVCADYAPEAAWDAANACIDAHGGYGFAEEYDVERKFREARLYKTAPINNNLVMAYVGEHVLGMPRSY